MIAVVVINAKWGVTDTSTRWVMARYWGLVLTSSIAIVVLMDLLLPGRGAMPVIPDFIAGALLGVAMGLSTISIQDLGTLGNNIARLLWVLFFVYAASLVVTYYALPQETHLLPSARLMNATKTIATGYFVQNTNGYMYLLELGGTVVSLRDDQVVSTSLSNSGRE